MIDAADSMLVHCGWCRHEWFAFKLPMPIFEAAELAEKMRCPECDKDLIYCGSAPVNTSARIENLEEQAHYANGVADLAMKHRDYAEQRVEKLEAALREIIVHCEVPAPPNAEALKMFARKALEETK